MGIGLLALALAMLCAAISIALSTVTVQSNIQPTQQTVNRALKGDRIVPALVTESLRRALEIKRPAQSPDTKLPDGCEALVSPFANPRLARTAGRCTS
jgi:hypothetical protein